MTSSRPSFRNAATLLVSQLRAALPAAICCILSASAQAGTQVAPGDVLRVAVLEAPEIDREAEIDTDGRIVLPRIGGIAVAGGDLDAVREQIADALTAMDIVRTPTVMVEFAAYRPVYVGGDIAVPGAIEFRPGLTVRHALILSGGIENGDAEPLGITDLMDLRAKLRANGYQLLQVESRIARLQAELDAEDAPAFAGLDMTAIGQEDADAIIDLQNGLYEDRMMQRRRDLDHFETGLDLVDTEIDVLRRQVAIMEHSRALRQSQIDSAREMYEKGLTRLSQVQELEQQGSMVSSDLLEAEAFAARARQTKETIRHELDLSEARRRIAVRDELATALAERVELESERSIMSSILLGARMIPSEDSASSAMPVPRITIYRTGQDGEVSISAAMDMPVEPGDLLQVDIVAEPRG